MSKYLYLTNLMEYYTQIADLASNDGDKGASLVGIEDPNNKYTGKTVEDALNEIADGATLDSRYLLKNALDNLDIPSGIKVEMLERTTNKTVTLSEEPYADQYTGYNVVIINITDNRLYTADGTQYLFPNINNANLTVSNKVVTTTGEDFDNYVLAVYITDENDGLAFQFKFMIFGMLASSLLSGHFMAELSSLETDSKTIVGAINELKNRIDNL